MGGRRDFASVFFKGLCHHRHGLALVEQAFMRGRERKDKGRHSFGSPPADQIHESPLTHLACPLDCWEDSKVR